MALRRAPPRRGRNEVDPRRPNHVLRCALAASFLLHLSAITVFRVVIYFPRQDIRYVEFQIVQAAPGAAAGHDEVPLAPGNPARREGALRLGGDRLLEDSGPPSVQLPTLEFAELSRLRMRREAALNPERRDAIFRDEDRDTWRRFGDELTRMRQSLSRLTLSGENGDGRQPEQGPGGPRVVQRPANGLVVLLEWDTEPQDRKLLIAPPIEALWEVEPSALRKPLTLIIEVNAMGRVINVWSPSIDHTGILDSVQTAVLKYRFEPLDDTNAPDQMGSLQVIAAEEGQ